MSRRTLLWAAVVLAAALAGWSASAEGGFRKYLKLTGEVATLKERNRARADENARLRREIAALRTDDRALERAAREELGYLRPGEIVLKLDGAR